MTFSQQKALRIRVSLGSGGLSEQDDGVAGG
jgi:hypothetical protein